MHVTAEEHFLDSTAPQFGRIGNASRLKIDEQARQYRPQLHLFPKRERTSAGADHPQAASNTSSICISVLGDFLRTMAGPLFEPL